MITPYLLHSHALSTFWDAELHLAKQIVRQVFIGNADQYRSVKPVGVLLGGQPASGKSGLIKRILKEAVDRHYVVINGDEFRTYHPRSRQISEHCGQNAPEYTQKFSNALVDYLKVECLRLNCNFIIEGTMRSFDVINRTATELKQANFQCEGHVLAVLQQDSLLGVFQRYESDMRDSGVGRFSPIEIHDEAYRQIPLNLTKASQAHLFDRVIVYSRQPDGRLVIGLDLNSDALASLDFSTEFDRLRQPIFDPSFYAGQWLAIKDLAQKRGETDTVYLTQIDEFVNISSQF